MKNNYPITGTFIDDVTYDIPSSNWTNEQWMNDLNNMKDVGIDTLILIRGVFYDRTNYPSKYFKTTRTEDDDFAGLILKGAAERGMNVYLGMHIANLTWNDGDVLTEIKNNKIFVDEVYDRYKDIPSFKGWYIPHEVGNDIFNICDVVNGLTDICKSKDPSKLVHISPFFQVGPNVPHEYSPQEHADEWDRIYAKCGKNLDSASYQDGVIDFDLYDEYFRLTREVCDKHNIELWCNTELIDPYTRGRQFDPIPFDVLKRKLNHAGLYTSKTITFEFSHFLSPQSIYQSARNLNRLYKDYYGKK